MSETIVKGFKDLIAVANPVQITEKIIIIILSVVFILAVFNVLKYSLGKLLKGKISEPPALHG